MSKTNKVFLGIFLAMFIIPELLWSPVINFGYELLQTGNTHPLRNNVITDLQNPNLIIFVLCIELLGSLLSIILITKNIYPKKFGYWSLSTSLYLFTIINLIVLYFAFAFRKGISL